MTSQPSAFIPIKGRCDLACAWCNFNQIYIPENNTEEVIKILKKKVKAGEKDARFGIDHYEPTTYSEFLEIVDRAKNMGFSHVTISTSGISLADPLYTKKIKKHGVTDVIMTIVSNDTKLGDILLGKNGATNAKMLALENCLSESINVWLNILLLRPVLRNIPETINWLRGKYSSNKNFCSMSGIIMDSVPEHGVDRYRLLMPLYNEIIWLIREIKNLNKTFGLQSSDLPLCVLKMMGSFAANQKQEVKFPSIKFVKPPSCENCVYNSQCLGINFLYQKLIGNKPIVDKERINPPPIISPKSLLKRFKNLSPTSEHCASPSFPVSPCYQEVKTALSAKNAKSLYLGGYKISEIKEIFSTTRTEIVLSGIGEPFTIIVEPLESTSRYYLKASKYAISHKSDSKLDTEAKQIAIRAIASYLGKGDEIL